MNYYLLMLKPAVQLPVEDTRDLIRVPGPKFEKRRKKILTLIERQFTLLIEKIQNSHIFLMGFVANKCYRTKITDFDIFSKLFGIEDKMSTATVCTKYLHAIK